MSKADGNGVPRDDRPTAAEQPVRVDKWLWYARFFKSRSLASRLCTAGKLRINRQITRKAHHSLKVGDVLTFPQGRDIRVVRVVAIGARRGAAAEAVALYEDLAPPCAPRRPSGVIPAPARGGAREAGAGRPTKADRRAIERLKGDA